MKTTLLITTFNRGHLLEKSLERLTHITLPDEVLIIDDGSNKQMDATKFVVKGFADRLPIRYLYNNNPQHSICSFARNIGVKYAAGDIIITAEPELLFVTDIIPQMLAKHEEFPNHIISIGTIYHMQEEARLRDEAFTNPEGFLNEQIVEDYIIEPRPYDTKGFVKTKNLQATFGALYRKDWIYEVGGWDEDFPGNYGWDDVDLCTRLRLKGYNQVVDISQEAIHQWHIHQPPHIGGVEADKNDKYFKAKDMQNADSPFIIANKGHEWGVLKELSDPHALGGMKLG